MHLSKWRKLGPEIAVVLGGGIQDDGLTPTQATLFRAQAAAMLALAHPRMTVILSGDGPPSRRRTQKITEAKAMRRVLRKHKVARKRIVLEDQSIDTIGNAVLVAARYLHGKAPRTVYVVTSPFHIERSVLLFRCVLGPDWNVVGHASAVADSDAERASNESGGIAWTQEFFAGIEPGDLHSTIKRLHAHGKPFYRTLKLLNRLSRTLAQ